MRRIAQCVGAEHHHIVEAHRVPVDLAQRGDPGGELAAQQADGEAVADLEVEDVGHLAVDRDQRRAVIALRPPLSVDQLAPFRQRLGIGEPALAAQHPGVFGNVLQVRDADVLVAGHRSAQRRHGVDRRAGRRLFDDPAELVAPRHRHIEHEQVGRFLGHGAGDLVGEAGLDARQDDEQGEPQSQRHHQLAGLRTRPVQIGERQPEQRGLGARQARGGPADRPADSCEHQQHARRRRDEPGGEYRLARGDQRQRDDGGDADAHRDHRRAIGPAVALDQRPEQPRGDILRLVHRGGSAKMNAISRP